MTKYTVKQAAVKLNRDPRSVYRWIKEGFILAAKEGKAWYITDDEINRALVECPKNTIIGRKKQDNKTL